jgi:putative peptidoglycan lipid II flippase
LEESESKKESVQSVATSAFRFSVGTLFSRITGMLREQTIAYFFGTSPLIAAFFVASRFALMFRRILGEGALLTGFIPKFEAKRAESEERAADFFADVHSSLFWFLLFLLFVFETLLFGLFRANLFSSENQKILLMMMMILPSLFFICLYALYSAFLQCKKRFFLTAVAPAVFNLSWLLAVFWVGKSWNSYVIFGLSLSMSLAYVFQWILLVPSSLLFFRPFFRWQHLFQWSKTSLELKALIKNVSLTAIGLGATQINGFLDTLFARSACLEGPAYLYYALRLHQLPLALIGVALSSALLPSLSRAFKEKDSVHFQELLSFGVKRVLTLILPSTFAIFSLGLPSIVLIYYRGCFSEQSVIHTTLCLWGFAIGLLPMTLVLLLNQAFYARQEYRLPTIAALLSVLFNLLLNGIFIWILKLPAEMVTLSTSLAAFFNAVYLMRKLARDEGSLFPRRIWNFSFRVLMASSFASIVLGFLGRVGGLDVSFELLLQTRPHFPTFFWRQLVDFLILSGTFFAIFLLSAYLLRIEEVFQLFWKKKGMEAFFSDA